MYESIRIAAVRDVSSVISAGLNSSEQHLFESRVHLKYRERAENAGAPDLRSSVSCDGCIYVSKSEEITFLG